MLSFFMLTLTKCHDLNLIFSPRFLQVLQLLPPLNTAHLWLLMEAAVFPRGPSVKKYISFNQT